MHSNPANPDPPPHIPPVAKGSPRPLWSVMIPVRNRFNFLDQALQSVLSQAPGTQEMQIEVVDNSTTDVGVEEFVRKIGDDRVNYFRESRDLSMTSNWNLCIQRSLGRLVHILHDDDYVAPSFYQTIDNLQEQHSDVGLFCCRAFVVSGDGDIEYLSTRVPTFEAPSRDPSPIFYANPLLTPSIVVRREVYESQGGYRTSLKFVPDWDFWLRAIRNFGIFMINQPFAYYRVHKASATTRLVTNSSEDLWEIVRVSKEWQNQFAEYSTALMRRALVRTAANQYREFSGSNNSIAADSRVRFVRQFGGLSDRVLFYLYRIWNALNRRPSSAK
jgi:glycosyltransferase involved in cell wall biosynthesis